MSYVLLFFECFFLAFVTPIYSNCVHTMFHSEERFVMIDDVVISYFLQYYDSAKQNEERALVALL